MREFKEARNGLLLQSSELKIDESTIRRKVLEQIKENDVKHELMKEAIRLGANQLEHEFIFFTTERKYTSDNKRNILGDYSITYVFLLAAVKISTLQELYSSELPQYIYMPFVSKNGSTFEITTRINSIKSYYEDMNIHSEGIPKNSFWKKIIAKVE